jgi:two-component system response regulator AtoC
LLKEAWFQRVGGWRTKVLGWPGAKSGVKFSMSVVEKSAKPHVLIVDDESLIRWSMAETLGLAGFEVSEAGDAEEALRRLSTTPAPDVILLDYRLPDSNDLRLLETIRQVVPDASVIMMTAYSTSEMVMNAVKLGAFRVLSKPLEMGDLAALVELAYTSRLH